MPSRIPLSISVICLPTEHLLGLLSDTDYWYIVTLNSGSASRNCRGPNGGLSQRLI
jgi:hypothetical protein